VVYSLFSCHKCACWSNPILTFLTFHEIEFATNMPPVLFTRNIFGSWLYLLMPFYYRHDCIHICGVWYELLKNKWNIPHCSACCVGSLLQYRLKRYYSFCHWTIDELGLSTNGKLWVICLFTFNPSVEIQWSKTAIKMPWDTCCRTKALTSKNT